MSVFGTAYPFRFENFGEFREQDKAKTLSVCNMSLPVALAPLELLQI